jgi:peroxiredoxin
MFKEDLMRILFVLAALALAACSQAKAPVDAVKTIVAEAKGVDADGRPLAHALVGKPIPDFSLPLNGGGVLSDESLKGKWSVVEFWGVWCGDCQADAEHSKALATAIAQDPSLAFTTVHVNAKDPSKNFARWGSLDAYVKDKGIAYPIAIDTPDGAAYRAFQMGWVPTYLVIDPQGIVRGFRTELHRDASPEGGVKTFLQEIAAMKKAAG